MSDVSDMLIELRSIRNQLADMDASDKREVRVTVDNVCDQLDDLIADEEAAEAQVVTVLVDPDA